MPENDFSNRELMLMFDLIKTELSHIKEQTTKTNGRLIKAEEKIAGFSTFQTKVMTVWALAVAGVTYAINKFI